MREEMGKMMKRFISIIIILGMLLSSSAWAVDLGGMSLDELYKLQDEIKSEILSRSQWESVTVKPGFYVVGQDIPEGHWTIRYSKNKYAVVTYFTTTDETGRTPSFIGGAVYSANIGDPKGKMADVYSNTEIDLELKANYYLMIEVGPVVFEPYTGRESPFF